MSPTCPKCGKPAGGQFCRHCGTTLTGGRGCGRCGGELTPDARFCARCGLAAGAGGGEGAERLRWFLAGAVVAAVLVGGVALLLRGGGVTAPPVAASGGTEAPFAAGGTGAPPDISNMSPRERFDRLYNRVMQAAESGDEATVTTFTPMALSAYGMLDTIDADARFHAALIKLHTGDVPGANALADSILVQSPGHLFGYLVRGTVARFNKDDAGLKRSYADFLSHYDAEQKAARREYTEHPRSIADFLQAARAGK